MITEAEGSWPRGSGFEPPLKRPFFVHIWIKEWGKSVRTLTWQCCKCKWEGDYWGMVSLQNPASMKRELVSWLRPISHKNWNWKFKKYLTLGQSIELLNKNFLVKWNFQNKSKQKKFRIKFDWNFHCLREVFNLKRKFMYKELLLAFQIFINILLYFYN